MTEDEKTYRPLSELEVEHCTIVERELREVCDRLLAEGFSHRVIVATTGALAGVLIAEAHGDMGAVVASAHFLGLAHAAAQRAKDQMEPGTRH